ncbi:MAG: LysM peptidoglycan-binding domain-containing protein, partial [Anaerolineae bacterium]|nr:LysM peptidoglycan-binding domain-containing protein [Anaerolineae bacterium]
QPGQGGGPTEGQPLAERPTDDPNAAYGTGGPNPPPGQAVAQAPPSLTPNVAGAPTGGGTPPQVFVTPTPTPMVVAQGPTLPPAAITATAITFNATATAAALLGAPIPTWTPMGAQPGYPTQQPYVQPGQYPPNATVITATPYGQGGICAQHEVQLGETLYSIARRYDVTAQQIQAQNAGMILNIDQISAGDVLLIPCVVPATATPVVVPVVTADPYSSGQGGQPVTTPTGTVMHTVQPGENLFSIARLYNVDGYELMRVNGYSAQAVIMIYEGEQLIIPNQPVVLTPTPIGYIGAPTPYIVIVTPYGQ